MRIYTEFIIAKEAEKGKSRNEFHCGFSLLRDMRDERIANLQQALEQDDDDQDRQHPLEIGLELGRELDARALVDLGKVLVKAPAPLRDAEQKVDKRADGQQEVAHKEVLAVEHVLAENGVEVAPDVVAEHAGKTQEHQHTGR